MTSSLVQITYLSSAALFVLALKWMSQVKTARPGNWAGTAAMTIAVLGTWLGGDFSGRGHAFIAVAVVVGAAIGAPMALLMPMTAVPQRTALSHSFGGLATALVGVAEYRVQAATLTSFTAGALATEVLLGFVTFTGSLMAFGKLQEILPGRPIVYPGRNVVSVGTLAFAGVCAVMLTAAPASSLVFYLLIGAALLFGVLLMIPIGGADMPTVIAILNSYAGLSACAMGFVLDNKLLIVAGALDGTSGLVLSILMCKAMNRSFTNVLFGAVGQVVSPTGGSAAPAKNIVGYTIEDAKALLEGTRLVIIVPGYGLAVARAQHAVQELTALLQAQGTEVLFAIHPVAGRMPGHMNVVLAEADVCHQRRQRVPFSPASPVPRDPPAGAEAELGDASTAMDASEARRSRRPGMRIPLR